MNIGRTRKLITEESVGLTIAELEKEFAASHSGETYFVDGNKSDDSGDGTTWATAYKNLATGLAASHANIAISLNRGWAKRNRIYCIADAFTEDLTKLAQKTDVIGVGSYNAGKQCGLIGNHVIDSTSYAGCRFFGFRFEEVDTGIVWTIPTQQSGIEFHDCVWSARGTNPTIGLKSTASYALHVINCRFEAVNGYTTACISLKTGVSDDTIIQGCQFGGAIGILIDNGVTNTAGRIWIDDNRFMNLTMCIDDNSDGGTGIAVVTRNIMVSEATIGVNMYDINLALAAGNIATGSDNTLDVPIKAA